MFRMSDGRYWARRSQHERMRPTEGNAEKMRTKSRCQRRLCRLFPCPVLLSSLVSVLAMRGAANVVGRVPV